MKNEKEFTTRFRKWFDANTSYPTTSVVEIKYAKGASLPFSRLEHHQKIALENAKWRGFSYKIPDFGAQNPFDMIRFVSCVALVVVYFEREKAFYLIDIDAWSACEESAVRKSITPAMAANIGDKYTF